LAHDRVNNMPSLSEPRPTIESRLLRAAAVVVAWSLALTGCGSSGTATDTSDGGSGASSGAASTGTNGGSGNSGSGGANSGSVSASGGSSASSGSSASGATDSGTSGSPVAAGDDGGACAVSASSVRVTEVDVGGTVVNSEDEASLMPLAISPISSGGSRLAWMSSDGKVHITQLDASDHVTGTPLSLVAHDFSDLYADNGGGVLLLTRDAKGGGNLNCGTLTNLCGSTLPSTNACWDMYMVRFDGSTETWAKELTTSSAALPPYSTGPTGPNVFFIWWYAHHGRIAFDGSHYAGFYGAAISVSQMCTNGGGTGGVGINIHQGDEMRVLDASGNIQSGGFDWGCSHSGYERIVWDPTAKQFVMVCKNDLPTGGKSGRLAFSPKSTTILPVDLSYSNFGNLVTAGGGGYWLISSDIRAGQTANSATGLADVLLLHVTTGAPDKTITLASDSGLNDRAPHLALYGNNRMLASWETSTKGGDLAANDAARKLYVQTLNATTGAAEGPALNVTGIAGNRYQDFRTFPDGSVAYPAPGTTSTKIKILRVLPCGH
jgi:hypothetical protein